MAKYGFYTVQLLSGNLRNLHNLRIDFRFVQPCVVYPIRRRETCYNTDSMSRLLPAELRMSAYRQLPAVDVLAQAAVLHLNGKRPAHALLVETARSVLIEAREAIARGAVPPEQVQLVERVVQQVTQAAQPSLRTVINATGVIIQTNLGRAPLSAAALAAMQSVGAGYSNLEYDLVAGERGSRSVHLETLLCQLTGAEAALAVNNNAAAIYLVLISLAAGREVIVSRGQAVEIGGGFRIPAVLRQSGATLVEVGTTNRTYASDYAAACNPQTALLMRIHTSNFRLTGFVHETPLAEMVQVAHQHSVAVLDDLGSGTLLPTAPHGLAPEPTVQESVAAGADLITFSGDKLLGGPQAGIIVGSRALIGHLKQHPLARAMRLDKTTIAGLEATLQSYRSGRALEEIPVWRMISAPTAQVQQRAQQLVQAVNLPMVSVVACQSAIGGGSLPGETLPSFALALTTEQPDELAQALRNGNPAIIGRIHQGQLLLDLRTVQPHEEPALTQAIWGLRAGG